MCGWEIAAYAAAAAAAAYGGYTQAEAANEAADRQAAALNAAMLQQDEWNKKAEKTAMDNAEEYQTEKRTNRLEEAMKDAGDSLTESLVTSREQIGLPEAASGRVSDEFTTDRTNKMAEQFKKSAEMANLMGRMRGVQDMLGNEGITNADYASNLQRISRNAQGDYNAAQPGIALAGKVNSGKVAAGALLQSLGTSYLAGGLSSGGGDITGSQAAAAYGTNAGSSQTGMLAAQEAGMNTGGWGNYVKGLMR